MLKLKQQLDISPSSKETSPHGAAHKFDFNFVAWVWYEDWKTLRMAGKVPNIPDKLETGSIRALRCDEVPFSTNYQNWNLVRNVLQLLNQYSNCLSGYDAYKKVNSKLFKTEISRSWSGFAQYLYGLNCHFAHGLGEVRAKQRPRWNYKTLRCRNFLAGYFPYGSQYYFLHKTKEQLLSTKGRSEEFNSRYARKKDMVQRWRGELKNPNPRKWSLQIDFKHGYQTK